VLAAALTFSIGGAGIKACQLTSWQVTSFRSGIAALTLLLLLPEARKRWNARAALVGVAYAATVTLFVLANKLTTSANTIFLQSTAPLYILLLSPWLLRERIHARDVLVMAVVALGCRSSSWAQSTRMRPRPILYVGTSSQRWRGSPGR